MTTHADLATPAGDHLKRFEVREIFGDDTITLEVDTGLLTPQLATEINTFWSGADRRLQQHGGDVVRAVICNFAERAMTHILRDGGGEISSISNTTRTVLGFWNVAVRSEEGWGGEVEGSDFGYCGIRIIGASIEPVTFDDLVVVELP